MKTLSILLSAVLVLAFAGFVALQFKPVRQTFDEGLRQAKRMDGFYRYRSGLPLRGTPDLSNLSGRLQEKALKLGAPIFMRIFKKEHELELWMRSDGAFKHFATYPICNWSGSLGPKLKEGDGQSPEGFYTVSRGQLNPNSKFHRSFNLGFPNHFDRAQGRTGSYLMVHGACVSIGCYAMTDPVIDEIWKLINEAFNGGQPRFHVHVYPFRMTRWNVALNRDSAWSLFWRQLNEGYDLFEQSHLPPEVSVCGTQYQLRSGSPGSTGSSVISKRCLPPQRTSGASPYSGQTSKIIGMATAITKISSGRPMRQ